MPLSAYAILLERNVLIVWLETTILKKTSSSTYVWKSPVFSIQQFHNEINKARYAEFFSSFNSDLIAG